MAKQKMAVNEEQILSFLQDALARIKTEEDPLELNVFRRLFRKGIPLTLRSYFAAYVLKEIHAGNRLNMNAVPSSRRSSVRQEVTDRKGRTERTERVERTDRAERSERKEIKKEVQEGRGRRQERAPVDGRTPAEGRSPKVSEPRPVLNESEATTLFISIGRNRRVYPRDLIGLIMQNAELEREHIGEIRVLDNYSFVQVLTVDAARVIEVLNEYEYRGRKLAVSYSRKREENPGASDDLSSTRDSFDGADGLDDGYRLDSALGPDAGDRLGGDDDGLDSDGFDDSSDYDADGTDSSEMPADKRADDSDLESSTEENSDEGSYR